MSEYVLIANSITKKYRNVPILNELSMHIKKGDIYGFVGRNGSGKTTFIRAITGLIGLDGGSFSLFDINNSGLIESARKKISAVVESPSIYLNLNAYDNLLVQCKVLGITDYSNIEKVLKTVDLSCEANDKKKAKDFSLGMRQRLGIAIALLGDPEFLILDEPINGLDPQGIYEIRELLLKLNREKGITILISSHILSELSKLATRFGFIEKGKILKEVSSQELEVLEQKSLELFVTNVGNVKDALEELKIKKYEIKKNLVIIYGEVKLMELFRVFDKANISIEHISENPNGLEDFYMNLIGSERNV